MAHDEPERESNHDPANITEERAARRFHQIRHLTESIAKIDAKITAAKDRLSVLKEQREGMLSTILEAANDEGDLPLFSDL